MSTVVQPRREAASYVSTHAGAVGEMVVDTTNQRITVHDGSTLGGFPQASIRDLVGFNLGINTNGAVNQRGVSGTVTLSAGQYGHDRMKAGASGCTYTFASAADGDTTFTITAGSLIQAVDVGNVFTSALWLTWTGTALARVYQGAASSAPALGAGSAVPIDGTTVNAILATGLALGTITLVEFGTGTLNTTRPWQLEAALPNAGPTRLGRRHGELALCQRYYQLASYLYGFVQAANQIGLNWTPIVPMRAIPTVTLLTTAPYIESPPFSAAYNGSGSAITAAHNSSGYTQVGAGFDLAVNGFSGLTSGATAGFKAGQLAFSAEL